jgi:hypothetical protein
VTYPHEAVRDFIERYFVPVRFNVVDEPDRMKQFNAGWTPTLIIEDAGGREHRRVHGYLDPPRFLAEMALARLKAGIDVKDYESAAKVLPETLEWTRGDPSREPEALYWAAVTRYKTNAETDALSNGWGRLIDLFPNSEWAKRAEFIRKK